MHGRGGLLLLLGLLPGSSALVYEAGVRGRSARRSSRSRVPTASLSSWEMSAGGVAMQSSSAGGNIMVDGMRVGPPPDMPSLLLSNRIVYLGTPISSQVTELIISDSGGVDDTCGAPIERWSASHPNPNPNPDQVTELIISELLYLQNDSTEKPVLQHGQRVATAHATTRQPATRRNRSTGQCSSAVRVHPSAGPELGCCAPSGHRTCRALGGSALPGGGEGRATGRPATAPGARVGCLRRR